MVLSADSSFLSPDLSLDSMAWLSGYWVGEAMGGTCEEIWSAPSNGSMVCAFKMSSEGQVNFYEIVILRQVEKTLTLQLKHFNAELIAWEEKEKTIDFKFIKQEKNTFYFDGISIQRIGDNRLNVYVNVGKKGEEKEVLFAYKRIV